MSNFNQILNNVSNNIIDKKFQFYIRDFLKSWFTNLNINDINILSIFGTYTILKISKLFFQDNIFERQFKKNNNQDIKAVILLLLPYINDENNDIYNKIEDLNELILTNKLINSDFKKESSEILKTHFKYTNIGIGLFDLNNEIKLVDYDFEKLIYKIIFHNFFALNETLSIINGKLYVNWINIYPMLENNYKKSNIYKNTELKLSNVVNNIINNNNFDKILNYDGLYIGEFYNVFRNVFYEDIKKVKWFIFIINKKYIIKYLDEILNFNIFFNNYSYDDLNEFEKTDFNISIINNISENSFLFWKNILLFFINNYSLIDIVFENFTENKYYLNKFKISDNIIDNIKEDIDDEFTYENINKFKLINYEDIVIILNNIELKHLWEFIKESLILFETTVYSKYLIKDNKIIRDINLKDTDLNYKNIYNIAKSLSHKSINEWVLLPTKYSSLTFEEQQLFWNKFTQNINSNIWINLKKNINLEYNTIFTNNEYENKMNIKLKYFNDIKYDLVWNYLITNGILSDFQENFKITDSKEYGISQIESIQKYIKTNYKKYENGYYFLTNTQYKYVDSYKINLFNEKFKWYSFYAMDWISQIGFYHHYLNHRVLYITGSTGQGKSTQVPKLFMYSLKMLDYKNNGKVICTQPRIAPTETNSSRISNELGVPIYYEYLKESIKLDNYYVQFVDQKDRHVKTKCNHLTLKLLTDGTLLSEITKNSILKEELFSKNNKIYSHVNKYDIIIIDEAHEHNTNMDLILTLARYSCFLNNDIKLVIMSATMDDDEPTFRRYYHIINDNLVYPLREKIYNYFLNNDFFLYDSIYLDRRFHIAPPGQTTQYNIKEIYVPNSNPSNIVNEIINTSVFGNILIFENGTNEIIKRVKELNKIIPKNIIALPYYSQLNRKFKKLIEDDLDINKITTPKELVNQIWNINENDDTVKSLYKYDRCIIIATNVAEASLTINNLKFVIDNGYAKVNKYSYLTDEKLLVPEEISEASRKQRKGRVGRTSSGTVYYLYKKGDREKNKPKYKITQENFGYCLIKLLELKNNFNDNSMQIHESFFDPNIFGKFIMINEEIAKINEIKNKNYYQSNIINIIINQFFKNNYLDYWDINYFNNMFENDLKYMYKNEKGFDINILIDNLGRFYIIHPYEHLLKRNILGNIISFIDDTKEICFDNKNNKISDNIYRNMLLHLNYKYLLVDIKLENLSFLSTNINYNNIIKTEMVDIINNMDEYLVWDNKELEDVIIILTSKAYNSFNEVLEILTLIKTINKSIKNLLDNSNIKKYNNQDNEIEYLYKIINDFKISFPNLNLFKIKNYDNLENKYKNDAEKLVNNFLEDYKINKIKFPKNKYTVTLWNKLISSLHNGRLKKKEGFMDFINDMIYNDDILYNFNKYIYEIKNWSIIRNINPDIMIKFCYNYISILLSILTIKKNFDSNKNELSPLEIMESESYSFKKSLTLKNNLEHIIRPFMHGYTFNIGLKINTHDNYYITNSSIKIINEFKKNNTNLFFYCYKKKCKDDNIYQVSITNKIEIEWLINVLPFYYKPSNFKNVIIKKNDTINICYFYGDIYDDFYVKLKNAWNLNNIPFESTKFPILKKFINNLKKMYN